MVKYTYLTCLIFFSVSGHKNKIKHHGVCRTGKMHQYAGLLVDLRRNLYDETVYNSVKGIKNKRELMRTLCSIYNECKDRVWIKMISLFQ